MTVFARTVQVMRTLAGRLSGACESSKRGPMLVAAGLSASLATTAGAQVTCWGSCTTPPAGVGSPQNPVLTMDAMRSHVVAILGDGSIAAWGSNSSGQTNVPGGVGTPSNPAVAVAAVTTNAPLTTGFNC